MKKIILGFTFSKGRPFGKPVELQMDEAALIPQVGDFICGETFSEQHEVTKRSFTFNSENTHVTLQVSNKSK
jgi:hypothetical protein